MVKRNGQYHRLRLALSTVGMFVIATPGVRAFDSPSPAEIKEITSSWVCKWCPYSKNTESEGAVTAGAGYISNDSYKNGDYTGLDEKGVYSIGELQYNSRSPENAVIEIRGNELGTDARDLSVTGRNGGSISGKFEYSELPKLNLDTARTPYTGSAHQQLPAGWTTGSDTQNMPQLASALHNVDVYTNRKTFTLSGNLQHMTKHRSADNFPTM